MIPYPTAVIVDERREVNFLTTLSSVFNIDVWHTWRVHVQKSRACVSLALSCASFSRWRCRSSIGQVRLDPRDPLLQSQRMQGFAADPDYWKGEVFAYVGLPQNLKDLKETLRLHATAASQVVCSAMCGH